MKHLPMFIMIYAFLVAEVSTGGLTKQCVYEGSGNTYVRTVNIVSLCPQSIQVELF